MGVPAGMTVRLPNFVLCSPLKPTWSPPQAYLGTQGGPKESSRWKDYSCWENCQPTLAVPSMWPCPRQHSQGTEPWLQREGAKRSHPPNLPTPLPLAKGPSQQHWRGRQLAVSGLSGLESLASEEKENGWGMDAGWGHRNDSVRSCYVASTVSHASFNSSSAEKAAPAT